MLWRPSLRVTVTRAGRRRGATALIAVIGSDRIHALGYHYIFFPILCGAIVLLMVALIINNLSTNPQRHYPVYWY